MATDYPFDIFNFSSSSLNYSYRLPLWYPQLFLILFELRLQITPLISSIFPPPLWITATDYPFDILNFSSSSLNYGYRLPLWYPQLFLLLFELRLQITPLISSTFPPPLWITATDYPFDILNFFLNTNHSVDNNVIVLFVDIFSFCGSIGGLISIIQ